MSDLCKQCVLLIGGNGFIGSHLQDEFKSHGYHVRVLSRGGEMFRSKQADVEYIEGDFSDYAVLGRAVVGCDLVVHLAQGSTPLGVTAVPEYAAIEQAGQFARMLSILNQLGVKNIVYFSSGGAVYGNTDLTPVMESSELNPVSPYGVSKLMMEKYLQMYAHLHDMKYMIVRPSNPYGPRQNFRSRQGVIPIFMRKMIMNETIEIWGDGLATKDYMYIGDFAKVFRKLIETGLDNNVYNIASGAEYSLNQLLEAIALCTGCTSEIVYQSGKKSDVQRISFSTEKLINRIGNQSLMILNHGIEETHDWLRKAINER